MSAVGDAIGGTVGGIVGGLGGGIGKAAGIGGASINSPVTQADVDAARIHQEAGMDQQWRFLAALQNQGGLANQSQVYNQLQGVASGTGPNPAQAMLANSTGQNVANQAALMAGQRGASQNAGMIARQAGMQGGALQQQAVGQSAALQAQQSLQALQGAGNLATNMVGNQAAATNAYANSALQNQQNQYSSIGGVNAANVQNQAGINQANAGIVGGLLGGAGAAMGGKAHGGMITPEDNKMNQGGAVQPRSYLAQQLKAMSKGGAVPVMLSPGEIYVPPGKVQSVAQGKQSAHDAGKVVPGQAKAKGDSAKNDTVPAKLESGGIVVPRTKANDEDKASKFVQAILAKQSMRKGK